MTCTTNPMLPWAAGSRRCSQLMISPPRAPCSSCREGALVWCRVSVEKLLLPLDACCRSGVEPRGTIELWNASNCHENLCWFCSFLSALPSAISYSTGCLQNSCVAVAGFTVRTRLQFCCYSMQNIRHEQKCVFLHILGCSVSSMAIVECNPDTEKTMDSRQWVSTSLKERQQLGLMGELYNTTVKIILADSIETVLHPTALRFWPVYSVELQSTEISLAQLTNCSLPPLTYNFRLKPSAAEHMRGENKF